MHYANHFAYLVSYHLLRKTIPWSKEPTKEPNTLASCTFLLPNLKTFPYQDLEINLWLTGTKCWDQETFIVHIAYRKYIGLANRLFSTFRYRKSYNTQFLNDTESNPLYSSKIRDKIRDLYFKTHRIVNTLHRFIRTWKRKRAKVQVNFDLYMTPLVLNHRHTFPLYQSGSLYLFSLRDLSNLIVTSITHHNVITDYNLDYFPKVIKNPYNNIPLTKSDLYNIYFQMKSAFVNVNEMIHRFFMCEFNIYQFAKENRTEIERIGVRTLLKNMSKPTLVQNARSMFLKYTTRYSHRKTIKFKYPPIHADFPADILIQKLRPYLELYFLTQYTIRGEEEYEPLLKCGMRDLIRYNPQFGQPIYTTTVDTPKTIIGFYDSTPSLDKSSLFYMDTHKYDDATNNRYSYMGDRNSTYDRGYDEIRELEIEPPYRRTRNGTRSEPIVESDDEAVIINNDSESEAEHNPTIFESSSSDFENERADDTYDD
jgi:hypothetical protein